MLTESSKKLNVHIRWMIRRDMPDVLKVESESFENGWNEEDFLNCLRQRNCIGMVAEYREDVVGFMIYELNKDKLKLLNFAVGDKYRRHCVGTTMIDKLISKLSSHRRTSITLELRETNIQAQLFYKAMGFKACRTLRNFYEDTNEDAYYFKYKLKDEDPILV